MRKYDPESGLHRAGFPIYDIKKPGMTRRSLRRTGVRYEHNYQII